LEVDEKFLDVESHSFLTGKKALHPVTFYAIQLSALFPQKKDFLASLKPQAAKTILWNS